MLSGAVLIWLFVMGTAVYAVRSRRRSRPRAGYVLIIGAGAIFPTVVLAGLLGFGLQLLTHLRGPDTGSDLQMEVSGEQWWWRVRYLQADGQPVETANEIRLPVGAVVELRLTSPDVIHSFWIPSLGGKMDMIPGRETRLVLQPTRTGEFRGACAEYCGASHALMAFPVRVMEPDAFAAWLERQQRPAAQPESSLARAGARLFLANGCGACHTVRGTEANGTVGPDLTHVGGRLSLGAGTLTNDAESFERWIGHAKLIKPDVRMPPFDMLPSSDLRAMAAYLDGLQ